MSSPDNPKNQLLKEQFPIHKCAILDKNLDCLIEFLWYKIFQLTDEIEDCNHSSYGQDYEDNLVGKTIELFNVQNDYNGVAL